MLLNPHLKTLIPFFILLFLTLYIYTYIYQCCMGSDALVCLGTWCTWCIRMNDIYKDCKGRSAQIESKEVRRMVTKLRGGTAQLRIETGRWKEEGREERKCKECSGQEVEDAKHFLLKCARWQDEREELIERGKGTQRGGEFEAAADDEKLAMILDGACKEIGAGMTIRKMWKRFV